MAHATTCRRCNRIAVRGGMCEQHRKTRRDAAKKADHNFYTGAKWRRLREQYISHNPLCEHCHAEGIVRAGKVVDHKIPRTIRPELELDWANLQTLCQTHHNRKTVSENG